MMNLTTLESILIVALVIVTAQYCLMMYGFMMKENATNTAIDTMSEMQKYNKELFDKLLKEEKLSIALAQKVRAYQNRYGDRGEDKITGLQ